MSIMLDILTGIKTDLQAIRRGESVDVQGVEYEFQTDIGANVRSGLDLRDLETDIYPAACINNVTAAGTDNSALPDMQIVALFSIEAGERLYAGDDWITVGDRLISDLQAGIDLNPAVPNAYVIVPGGGRPVYEWLKPKAGSNVVLVRRWYAVEYQEQYRASGPYFR